MRVAAPVREGEGETVTPRRLRLLWKLPTLLHAAIDGDRIEIGDLAPPAEWSERPLIADAELDLGAGGGEGDVHVAGADVRSEGKVDPPPGGEGRE